MIHSFSLDECLELLNHLNNKRYLTRLEDQLLTESAESSPMTFCNELIEVYKDRVEQYLEDTSQHLSTLLKIPLKVAEDISVGYIYSILAQTNFYTSPFALLSIFCGKIDAALEEKVPNQDLFSCMKKYRATLGVSLGLYSMHTYFWLSDTKSMQDSALNALLQMNRVVFINMVALWQLYQELGFVTLACVAQTSSNELISKKFLDSIQCHELLLRRINQSNSVELENFLSLFFRDDENFTLLKQSLFLIIDYIQEELLKNYFDSYFQNKTLFNVYNQLFFYKIGSGQFNLKNLEDRIKLMRYIYFSYSASKENFLDIYPSLCYQLQNTFKSFQKLCGNVAYSKLRLIDRTIEPSNQAFDALKLKTDTFFEKMRERLRAADRENQDKFQQSEGQVTDRNIHLSDQVNQLRSEHQAARANLDTGIQENRERLAQQGNRINQFEHEATQKIDMDTDILNRNIAECREHIRTYCGSRFFIGVNNQIIVDGNGRMNMPLHQITLQRN